jgi:methylated-DNA-[protein]-cysteine S-methyltransferase
MDRLLGGSSDTPAFVLTHASDPFGLTAVMRRYFAGDLAAIDRVQVAAQGTDFQTSVWRALREIPCGQTRSYGSSRAGSGVQRLFAPLGSRTAATPWPLSCPAIA